MAGLEPSFGVNSFNKAKYKNETETIATSVVNLLLGKPGYFPSMPNLGINIQDLIYQFWDDIDVNIIKAKIVAQCQVLEEYVDSGELDVVKADYNGDPLLLVIVPVQVKNTKERLAIGITQNSNGQTMYNYVFDSVEY